MTHRYALAMKADAEPWQLLEDNPLRERLGLPVEPYPPSVTVSELMTPRLGPGTIREPLRLDLEGATEASLHLRARGFGADATTDLVVSPALLALLAEARLPDHAQLRCEAYVFPEGTFGVLPPGRSPKGPHPLVWLWWQERFVSRIDPRRSRFRLRYPDGRSELASYDSLDDLAQVKRRAANTLAFEIEPERIAWSDPAVDALDLVPLGEEEVYLSDALAERIGRARLPGVEVRALDRSPAS